MVAGKVKIAHVVEGFVGGLVTYMFSVLPELQKRGFEVHLICSLDRLISGTTEKLDMTKKLDHLRKMGIVVHIVPMARKIRPLQDFYCFIMILKLLRKYDFDVVHIHCSKAGAIGRTAAKVAGIKAILYSSHCFAFVRCQNTVLRKIYHVLEQFFAKFTTKFIAVSDAEVKISVEASIFPKDKCVSINNGLRFSEEDFPVTRAKDRASIRSSFGIPETGIVVLTACRLIKYKGFLNFLEAAKLVHGDCIFMIAGDGPDRSKIQKYINDMGLSKKVRMLGHLSDMTELYKISGIALLCSIAEAQPYFLLEAMRARLHIVATDVPGNRELVGYTRGLLVEQSPQKIAQAINHLIDNADKKKRHLDAVYLYVKENHNLQTQTERLVKVYESAMAVKAKRRSKERAKAKQWTT